MNQITPHSLRVVRNVVNLTQKQLADLIGVSRSYIAYLELGERTMTIGIQKRLQDVLGWNKPETQAIIAAVDAWRQPHEDV
ncbi:helix-turn-helix transcriptional regulator [Paenibacillus xylanexedens]|uniref:helix-turn-helix transcriptional regulator n=1 Tax=Paenibacillus xylanexedens TaxID=528191 RepID=UPI000F51FA02|nr:helix-turn-helix transcriptional regulator [Paenibacillus xylanexedens]RPK16432.1 hypothetical protein EDO6_03093 [Paenibacillus xylanexedens]